MMGETVGDYPLCWSHPSFPLFLRHRSRWQSAEDAHLGQVNEEKDKIRSQVARLAHEFEDVVAANEALGDYAIPRAEFGVNPRLAALLEDQAGMCDFFLFVFWL